MAHEADGGGPLRRGSSAATSGSGGGLLQVRSAVVEEVIAVGSDPEALERALRQAGEEEAALKAAVREALAGSLGGGQPVSEPHPTDGPQHALQVALGHLERGIPTLQTVFHGASKLDARITETRAMADDVSKRVREIDLARSRALAALAKVRRVMALRACLRGVKEHMDAGDLGAAAQHVHDFRHAGGAAAPPEDAPVEDSQAERELREVEALLAQAVLRNLEEAIERRDDEGVLAACQTFARLGQAREGVSRLLRYRCEQLKNDVLMEIELTSAQVEAGARDFEYGQEEDFRQEAPAAKEGEKTFLNLLVYLINQSAGMIQRTGAVVRRSISPEPALQRLVVRAIHGESDKLMTHILRLFLDKKRIEERVKIIVEDPERLPEAMALGHRSWVEAGGSEALFTLDTLLDELALTLKHTETYRQFLDKQEQEQRRLHEQAKQQQRQQRQQQQDDMRSRRRSQGESVAESDAGDPAAPDAEDAPAAVADAEGVAQTPSGQEEADAEANEPLKAEYVQVVHELAGYYCILEERYMRSAMTTALEQEVALEHLSTSPEEDTRGESKQVTISSTAEDCFYVLGKCIDRAKTTAHLDSACAVVDQTVRVLGEALGSELHRRAGAIRNAASLSAQGQEHLASLRAAAISQAQASLGRAAQAEAPEEDPLDAPETTLNTLSLCIRNTHSFRADLEAYAGAQAKLKNCVDGLLEPIEGFQRSLDLGLDRLTAQLAPRLREQVESTLGSADTLFEVSESEYLAQQGGWVLPLVSLADTQLREACRALDVDNCAQVGLRAASAVAKAVEHAVVRKKFSPFGALLLDKQLRDLLRFFEGPAPPRDARRRFQRVRQICALLNLDAVQDVHDVYVEDSAGLATRDVKRVLALRADFKTEDIKRLKL